MAVVVDGDRDGEPVLVEGLRAKVPRFAADPRLGTGKERSQIAARDL